MKFEKYDNVWFALEANEADVINMTLSSGLMISIERVLSSRNLSQAEAAKRLGLTRPRLNDLLRGKTNKFSLDALTALASRAGLTVKISIGKTVVKRVACANLIQQNCDFINRISEQFRTSLAETTDSR